MIHVLYISEKYLHRISAGIYYYVQTANGKQINNSPKLALINYRRPSCANDQYIFTVQVRFEKFTFLGEVHGH